MDEFDVFASKPSNTQENDAFNIENTDHTTKNLEANSPWDIENDLHIEQSIPSGEQVDSDLNPLANQSEKQDDENLNPSTSQSDKQDNQILNSSNTESDVQEEPNLYSSTIPPIISDDDNANTPQAQVDVQGNDSLNYSITSSNIPDDDSLHPPKTETIIQNDNNLNLSTTQPNVFDEDDNLNSWVIPSATQDHDNLGSSETETDRQVDYNTNPSTLPSYESLTDTSSSNFRNPFDEGLFNNTEVEYAVPPTAEEVLSDSSTEQQFDNQSAFYVFSTDYNSPLQVFERKRQEEIAAKDAVEKTKIEELRKQAKADLENWENERRRQIEHKKKTMREEDTNLRAIDAGQSSAESCDWSKVIRLVDFTDGKQSSKSKRDLTRMKACILTARRISESKKLSNGN